MLKNKKGFTLVEVIVVLVILAILAAIMIPSFKGWIDKARDKSDLVECRNALLACQTIASETYAKTPSATSITISDANTLAEFKGTGTAGPQITACTVSGGKVTAITFRASSATTYTYSSTTGNWTK